MTIKRDITIRTQTKANGTTTVIASTPNPDRYSDVVASDWRLEAYMENPVVQFGHRYDIPPVGRTESLKVDKQTGNLVATIRWDDSPTNQLAQTVASQFRNGFLRAVSVGFQPSETTPRNKLATDHPAHGEKGMYFTGNKLLEISAVPVPANAESLALRAMGLSQAKSIINVEETEDTYIVTYQKYPGTEEEPEEEPEEAPPEDEEEAMDDDDDDDQDEAIGDDDEEDEDEEEPRQTPYDDDDDDDEEEKAHHKRPVYTEEFGLVVRTAILDLLGHDSAIQAALTVQPKRRTAKTTQNGIAVLFGIDK